MKRYMFCRQAVCKFLGATFLLCALPLASVTEAAAAPADGNSAKGWHAVLGGHEALPRHIVAVDKKRQTLFLFDQQSPLRLAARYACTTGQNEGDKLVRGDFKTPEGVYFVVSRLTQGLDFEKYGHEAYTLNYPNPVDRLRKKTGSGIWIHGRGVPIAPYITEGCVSLNNRDIASLAQKLTPGAPVALAENISFTPKATLADKAIIDSLNRQTFEWAKAWADRSKKLFDFYDPEAYGIAQGESFAAFRAQKERVFKTVSSINIQLRNVQTLPGPGYWVTWFQQDYKASNLSTQGVRRLYWRRDAKGAMRIVGMEWYPHLSGTLSAGINEAPASDAAPHNTPMIVTAAPDREAAAGEKTAAPKEPAAAAEAKPAATPQRKKPDVAAFIETWRAAWEKGDLAAYTACYDERAVQGSRTGSAAIRAHKQSLWRKSPPKKIVLTNLHTTTNQKDIIVKVNQLFTDSNNFSDRGIKTLRLALKGNSWRIVREDWNTLQ